MNKPDEFGNAIQGCEFVFHVATPLELNPGSQYKSTSEVAVASARSIATSCARSGTVKRLIYTASVFAASPLKDDGSGFKDFMDEKNGGELEVATLAFGLVGGDTLLPYTPGSVAVVISQIKDNPIHYNFLKHLEELLGKVPLIHIEDVCGALIFCMENPSIQGRVLSASSLPLCS
uniref:Uncharacterized protein n=1 Tax=Ficus carica TaxID=3494 RepID=A0AA88CHI5_FICCA|nr:hypothetical protein TIFTF001_042989 [Ficus carica]